MTTSAFTSHFSFGPLLSTAHPTFDTRGTKSTTSDTIYDTTYPGDTLNVSAPYQVRSFEYYAAAGFARAGQGVPDPKLELIEVHTLGSQIPSADAKDWVAMKLYVNAQVHPSGTSRSHFWLWNWNQIQFRPRNLERWSDTSYNPKAAMVQKLADFALTDLKIRMVEVFTLLHQAKWTDEWDEIYVGKFENPPAGHPSTEPFYAFYDGKRPERFGQYIYVGAVSGQIVQDAAPWDLASGVATTLSSGGNVTAVSAGPAKTGVPTS